MKRSWYRSVQSRRVQKSETDNRRRAVALTYDDQSMAAPTVSALGQEEIAERIIALAEEHGVAIRHDPDLVTLLAQLDVGQMIPPELYAVVAEVLAFVYQLKGKEIGK